MGGSFDRNAWGGVMLSSLPPAAMRSPGASSAPGLVVSVRRSPAGHSHSRVTSSTTHHHHSPSPSRQRTASRPRTPADRRDFETPPILPHTHAYAHALAARATPSPHSRAHAHSHSHSPLGASASRTPSPAAPIAPAFTLSRPSSPQRPRTRPTTPSRIPTRPRAYSASASTYASAREELLDPVPPLPVLSPAARSPRSPFPPQPATPPMSTSLSVSPDAPHRLAMAGGMPSGIPVLKGRGRSQRSPSPDLPTLANGISEELPPFRVDLDTALAEIEDELEQRAAERYAQARPANASTSLRTPKAVARTRSAASTPGSARDVTPRRSAIPTKRTPTTAASPRTPMGSLGRAATISASERSRPTPTRKRHGSDTTQSLGLARRPPNGSSFSTPTSAGRPRASLKASPAPGSSPGARLGIAAHFVPPDPTPLPQGAAWDDVVLPTVAKKLGISVSSHGHGAGASSEDELAVEWDRDGTPVRWASPPRRDGGTDFGPRLDEVEMEPMRHSGARPTDLDRAWLQTEAERRESAELRHEAREEGRRREAEREAQIAQQRAERRQEQMRVQQRAQEQRLQHLDQQPPQQLAQQPSQQPQQPQQQPPQPQPWTPRPMSQHPPVDKRKRADDDVKGGCSCVIM